MRVAVVRFPGSNCDLDVVHVLRNILRVPTDLSWHKSFRAEKYDAAILPGGFSYGDYLRAGAIAAHSPALEEVRRMAEDGKPIIGICNGFQILIEAGLLPGALLRNSCLTFSCKWVTLKVETEKMAFTRPLAKGTILRMPIAHGEGRYVNTDEGLKELVDENLIVFRYVNDRGEPTLDANPNGSADNIAGICNEDGNVLGLMPHPERSSEPILSPTGTDDGLWLLESMIKELNGEPR